MAESKEKKETSSKNSRGVYYLTVYILPGDGTPRILPTSIEITKESYVELKKMFDSKEPIPDQFRFRSPEGENPEVFNFLCERVLSVTVDKIEPEGESKIILAGSAVDSRKIYQ